MPGSDSPLFVFARQELVLAVRSRWTQIFAVVFAALAVALVVWFAGVALFDVAALGLASMLRSGTASRVLVAAIILNPVDAVRTGTLLGIEGVTAFGSASLAFLRITRGPLIGALLLGASVLLWTIAPVWLAARRLARVDI